MDSARHGRVTERPTGCDGALTDPCQGGRVIVRPMLGDWAVPRIERISALDRRRLARVSVPGLEGDLHHDLGAHSLVVEIEGSLHGDAERDEFLTNVREPFLDGEPLTFVADITTATKLERVIIEFVAVEEVNDSAREFRYHVGIRQYVEPPEPPPAIDDLGVELGPQLDLLADLGLAGLELPNLLGDIPSIGDPTPPLREALSGVEAALAPLHDQLAALGSAFS